MLRFSLALFVLALTAPALAEQSSYNFLKAGYQRVEIDLGGILGDLDGDGYLLSGSFEIGESMYFFAGYSTAGFDFDVDLDELNAGFGFHNDISANTDFFASLSYVQAEVDVSGVDSADDDGYGVAIGLGVGFDEDVTTYGAGMHWYFGE